MLLALLVAVTAGCSIHPQTEDISRVILPDIIHKVRCEAKDAILKVFPNPKYYLRQSGVNFDFTFVITENNDATSKGSVQIPMIWGSFTAGWDAGAKNERATTQTVNISDAFARLVTVEDCGPELPRRNYMYPLTGQIGLAATFENYRLIVEQRTGLIKEFTDQVKFTTTVVGNLMPSVRIAPGPGRLTVADATFKAQRIDVHQVKLTFSVPQTPEAAEAAKVAAAKAKLKERQEKLLELAEEKRLPTSVQLVGPDGRPIAPGAFGQAPAPDGKVTKGVGDAPDSLVTREVDRAMKRKEKAISAEPKRRAPSIEEIERRTYETYDENETRRFNRDVIEELRRRGTGIPQ